MGCSKSSSEREVYSNTCNIKKKKIQINNWTLFFKVLEKEQAKPQVRKHEIMKIWVEINEIKNGRIIKCSMKLRFFLKLNKTDKPLVRLRKDSNK